VANAMQFSWQRMVTVLNMSCMTTGWVASYYFSVDSNRTLEAAEIRYFRWSLKGY